MRRIVIVGASGSGKSTLGEQLSSKLGIPLVDLDRLFHRPNWEPTPTPEFRAKVIDAIDVPAWVVAGNYTTVMDLTHRSADTIVWLDLPRWRSTMRVVRRSLGRVIRREQLWNGNRERWRNLVNRDPEQNIILWAWQSHPIVAKRYEGFATGPFWAHADVRRLTTPRQVRQFLESAEATQDV